MPPPQPPTTPPPPPANPFVTPLAGATPFSEPQQVLFPQFLEPCPTLLSRNTPPCQSNGRLFPSNCGILVLLLQLGVCHPCGLGFQLTGPFIIIAFEMILTDIPAFLLVVSIFLGAFASTLYTLSDKEGVTGFVADFEACLSSLLHEFDQVCGPSLLVLPSCPQQLPQK